MKRILAIAIISVFSFHFSITYAQKGKAVDFTRAGLPGELQAYFEQATSDKEVKSKTAAMMAVFASQYGALDGQMQDRVTAVFNRLQKLRVRPYPDVSEFVEVFNRVSVSSGGSFGPWVECVEFLQSRNKKVKDITDFVAFTDGLLTDRTLYASRSCTWQLQSGCAFSMRYSAGDIAVVVDKPVELYYSSDKDNGTIYGTRGVYHYLDNRWEGEGGRLNWDRTGIPTTACWASLSRYEAVTKFPKFVADSVQFTNTNYFSKPIYGRVEEALSARMEPEKYSFPKFRSYQKDFKMKDILPGVDYSGSFMMNGSKFVTSDTKNPATLIFYRQGKTFATVQSVKFTITATRIVSENAAVKLYIDGDSISNNGITVRYLAQEKQLNLINDSRRNYYSPYSDSYHNMDLYCEQIVWKMAEDKLEFSMLGASGDQSFSTFESNSYYSEAKFREIGGIDEINPVIRVYRYMQTRDMIYEFFMDDFAKYIKMDIMQAKSMVHNLARSGLVSYNEAQGKVYVNDKLVDYAKASAKSQDYDYDALVLHSASRQGNADLDLSNNALNVHGVEKFVLSDSQQVVIYPRQGELVVGKNRDINFDGRIHAGRFIFYATGATFLYDDFKLDLPQVDSMIFYVAKFNNPQELHVVYTPLHNLTGFLQIDQSDNHSGLKRVEEKYPIFTSQKDSYVYYDRKDIYKGTYVRDRFYYTIHPFVVKDMVDFVTDSLSFNGVLTSAGIFPDIDEPLKVQPDYSLGFVRKTPRGGYQAYGGKGRFTNRIDLSYRGLRGQGQVDYLTSVTQSKNIVFMPDSMVSVSDTFYVKEQGAFPDIRVSRACQRWHPYADSMLVQQLANGPQFKMYHNDALLSGSVVLKPEAAYAMGAITIREGTLESPLFVLAPKEMDSRVTAFTLRSDTYKNTAFYATDMKSHVDYTKRRADFVANLELERTQLPLLQYAAYVDKFSWEMDKKQLDLINSKSESGQGFEGLTLRERFAHKEQPGALFVSTDPAKDSLHFHAVRSTYMYDAGQLTCRQVFTVDVADAVVAPGGDTLHISRGGLVGMLKHSQILASRENRHHLIYDADVLLDGAKRYSGKGYIDYVDVDNKKQKIYLTEIAPDSRGVSVGKGFVPDSANFTLNSAFGFAGNVRVEADREFYFFDGGVRLLHKCNTGAELGLLAYSSYLNPRQILVSVPEIPTDWKGNRITASMLFDKKDMMPYAAFLTAERAADNELMGAHGYVTYDNDKHEYMIASAEKIQDPDNVVDRFLTLNTQTCEMTAEGPIDFNVKQHHVKLFNYGMATLGGKKEGDLEMQTIFGFTFPIDDKVLGAMAQIIGDDLRLSPSTPGNEATRHSMLYYMGAEHGAEAYATYVSTGFFDKMPKEYESTILIEGMDWTYDPALGYRYDGVASLAMVGNKQLHLSTRVKAQLYRKGNGVHLVLYIQVAADHWYYFNYEFNSQQMLIQSSVGEWVDMIKALSADKRHVGGRGDVGDYRYRITPSRTEVPNFLLRMGGNAEAEDDPGDWDVDDEDVIEGDD